jgi:hypothetical protein
MKKLISIFGILILLSCKSKTYKYQINGEVYIPSAESNRRYPATWYTDTISFDSETAYYFNSDGSEVRIEPPYILKYNK